MRLAEATVENGRLERYLLALSAGKTTLEPVQAKGRGLFAQQPFDIGEEIFSEQAYSAVLEDDYLHVNCSACFRSSRVPQRTRLLRCTACEKIYYCSAACQKWDWQDHRVECKNLRAKNGNMNTMERLFCRIYRRRARELSYDDDKKLFDLGYEFKSHREDMKVPQITGIYQGTQWTILTIGKENMPPEHQVLDYICRVATNGVAIHNLENELMSLGKGIYYGLAMVNHSCSPNTTPIFSKSQVSLRAIRNIAKGEELTLNYIDVMQSTETRRTELKKVFFFTCQCERCMTTDMIDPMSSLKCTQKKCTGYVPAPKNDDDLINKSETNIEYPSITKINDWSAKCNKCNASRGINRYTYSQLLHTTIRLVKIMNNRQSALKSQDLLLHRKTINGILHLDNAMLFLYDRALIYFLSIVSHKNPGLFDFSDPYYNTALNLSKRVMETDHRFLPAIHPICLLAIYQFAKLYSLSLRYDYMQLPPSNDRHQKLCQLKVEINLVYRLYKEVYEGLNMLYGAHPMVKELEECIGDEEKYLQVLAQLRV